MRWGAAAASKTECTAECRELKASAVRVDGGGVGGGTSTLLVLLRLL